MRLRPVTDLRLDHVLDVLSLGAQEFVASNARRMVHTGGVGEVRCGRLGEVVVRQMMRELWSSTGRHRSDRSDTGDRKVREVTEK